LYSAAVRTTGVMYVTTYRALVSKNPAAGSNAPSLARLPTRSLATFNRLLAAGKLAVCNYAFVLTQAVRLHANSLGPEDFQGA